MVDPDVFHRRLARLAELLGDLEDLARTDRVTYLADRRLRAQAERWLHLSIECCLDLANHWIADQGWPTPATYREAFRTLAARGVIPADLARTMEGWAGLRNVLVHLYLEIDHQRIHDALAHHLPELRSFAACVAAAASAR